MRDKSVSLENVANGTHRRKGALETLLEDVLQLLRSPRGVALALGQDELDHLRRGPVPYDLRGS